MMRRSICRKGRLRSSRTYEGPVEPRGSGGITNIFSYKNFTISWLITTKFDYKIRLNSIFRSSYSDFASLPGELADRWVVPGDELNTNIPAILETENPFDEAGNRYQLYNFSQLRVADGFHLRLKNVRLGYSAPRPFASKLGLSRLSLNLEAQNLALLYSDSRLNGQDPEFFNTGGVALPQPRLVTLSINLGL